MNVMMPYLQNRLDNITYYYKTYLTLQAVILQFCNSFSYQQASSYNKAMKATRRILQLLER